MNQSNSIVISTFQGFPTHFDFDSKQWIHLTEEFCFIELTTPPGIFLSNGNRMRFLSIQLKSGFQYHMQSCNSLILNTSDEKSAQTYGFRLPDEGVARAFEEALARLKQCKEQYMAPTAKDDNFLPNFNSTQQQHRTNHDISNPFKTAPLHSYKKAPTQFTGQRYEDMTGLINPMKNSPSGKPTQMFQTFAGAGSHENYFPMDSKDGACGGDIKLNDFISQYGTNEPTQSEEELLCDMLSQAIEEGNIIDAEEFVTKLADKKTKINITPLTAKKAEFNILIQVEDKNESEGTLVTESVDPYNTTILMLKYQIFRKYQFPVDVQIWIINKSIAKDDETLSKCGIKTTGTTVYLYLKSIEDPSVKLMKLKYDKEVQTDENITMYMNSMYNQAISQEQMIHQFGNINVGAKNNDLNLYAGNNGLLQGNFLPVTEREGWECVTCTLKNLPTFEGCTACTSPRPKDYKIPPGYKMHPEETERIKKARLSEELALKLEYQRKADEAMAAQDNYTHMLQVMDQRLLPNQEDFECSVCMEEIKEGDGVMLRDCLHCFCKECLIGTIQATEDPEIRCPHNDGFACLAVITMQEIEELLIPADYGKYLAKSLQAAERGARDSFHCRSANCIGWCFYEDDVNDFICPICGEKNCLTCKAIHPNQSCQAYQDDLKIRAENDEAAKKTQQMLQELITRGEAMNCPQCAVILQKKSGCDWMRCTMCRCEICWATKGPRWGPKGNGDTTGGCKCGINGRCIPTCGNCH